MKTNEELNALKEEIEALNKKLAELSNEELMKVVGGSEEFTILPHDQGEFWRSWNPGFPANPAHPDTAGVEVPDWIIPLDPDDQEKPHAESPGYFKPEYYIP